MKYHIQLTDQTKSDIAQIYDYYANECGNSTYAHVVVQQIRQAIYSLDTFPKAYPRLLIEPWQSRGWRKMVLSQAPYLILYYISENEKTVYIGGVIHAHRQLAVALQGR